MTISVIINVVFSSYQPRYVYVLYRRFDDHLGLGLGLDDDRDGHRNIGTIRTLNVADSPRRLHHELSWLLVWAQ